MRISIKKRLATYFILAIVIISVSISTVSIIKSAEQMEDQNRRILFYATRELHNIIGRSLQEGVRDLNSLAGVLESSEINDSVLQQLKLVHPEYEDIIVADTSGRIIASSDYKYTSGFGSEETTLAALRGRTSVSDLQQDDSGNRMITFARPLVHPQGRVLALRMNVESFFYVVREFRAGRTGFMFVLDEKNRIIDYPDEARIFQQAPADLIRQIEIGQDRLRFSDGGESYFGNYYRAPLGDPKAASWSVVAVINRQEYLDNFYNMLYQIVLATAVFLLIGIIGALFIAESFTNPIIKVKEQIQKISWGDLDVKLDLKRDDEIGELAKSFDEMMITLREYSDAVKSSQAELENKVRERTAELEKAFRELKKLDEMKDNLISSVSHELRTPLTSIRSYNQLLREGMLGNVNKKQKDALDVVLNCTDQLIDLVNNILESARFASGRASFNFREFDLQDLVHKVVKEFDPRFRQIRAKVDIICPPKLKICADEMKIREVLINIINNSFKYRSSRKLAIYLIIEDLKDTVKMSITDNGIGIPKEGLKNLFNKFYQVDQGATRKVEGTGLGLSIVKHIIEGHKGTIHVYSEPDIGTEVIISLPKITLPQGYVPQDMPMPRAQPKKKPSSSSVDNGVWNDRMDEIEKTKEFK